MHFYYLRDVVTLTSISRFEYFGTERVDSEHLTVLVETHGVSWQLAGVAQRRKSLLHGLFTKWVTGLKKTR